MTLRLSAYKLRIRHSEAPEPEVYSVALHSHVRAIARAAHVLHSSSRVETRDFPSNAQAGGLCPGPPLTQPSLMPLAGCRALALNGSTMLAARLLAGTGGHPPNSPKSRRHGGFAYHLPPHSPPTSPLQTHV